VAVDPTKLKAKARRLAVIDEEICSGCATCIEFCPVAQCIVPLALSGSIPWQVCRVVPERCIGCTLCVQFCPWESITMVEPSRREALAGTVPPSPGRGDEYARNVIA